MKKRKKICALITALIVFFSSVPIFEVNAAGEYKITVSMNDTLFGDVRVIVQDQDVTPSEIEGMEQDGTVIFSIDQGSDYLVTITPAVDYHLESLPDGFTEDIPEDGNASYSYNISQAADNYNWDLIFVENEKPEVKNYEITVTAGSNGEIIFDPDGENRSYTSESTAENPRLDEINMGAVFKIVPEEGFYVSKVKINGAELERDAEGVLQNADDSYLYTFPAITADSSIETEYTEISSQLIDNITVAGVKLELSGDAAARPGESSAFEYTYILTGDESAVLTADTEKQIKLGNEYVSSYDITQNQQIGEVTVRNLTGDWKDSVCSYTLMPVLQFKWDNGAPFISLDKDEIIWLPAEGSEFQIDGKISDNETQVEKVVWFTTELNCVDDKSVIVGETENIAVIEGGTFSIRIHDAPDEDTTYYIYVIDKAGNISMVQAEMKRDITGPQVKIETKDITSIWNKLFTSKRDIEVKVNASDEQSGTASVTLFINDEEKETKVAANGEEVTFKVKLKKNQETKITAIATDKVGNKTTPSAEIDGGPVSYDGELPEIKTEPGIHQFVKENIIYGNQDIELEIEVSDSTSGLAQIEVKINGEVLTNDLDGKELLDKPLEGIKANTYRISTAQAAKASDGMYHVDIRVSDAVGHVAEKRDVICVDETAPEIWGISIRDVTGIWDKLFTKMQVIEVSARVTDSQSGAERVILLVDGAEIETRNAADNEEVTFKVRLRKEQENIITAAAVDKVGNRTKIPTEISGGSISYDDDAPLIETKYDSDLYVNNGIIYSMDDVELAVTVSDQISGLARAAITINDVQIANDINGNDIRKDYTQLKKETFLDSFIISTSQIERPEDGIYRVEIRVVDIVGRESVHYDVIYRDDLAPEIRSIDVSGKKANGMDTAAEGSKNITKRNGVYGYYGADALEIAMSISDGEYGSGVKTVEYYYETSDGTKSRLTTASLDNEGKIKTELPADFKGYLFVKTTDYAGNMTDGYYTTDGFIVESQKHYQAEEHVSLTVPESSIKDKEGNNLYSDNINAVVVVKDTFSGIRSIEWSVIAPNDTAANDSGIVDVDNRGNLTDNSWQKTSSEQNLATTITKTIPISNNSNDIVIKIKATSRAGYVSEDSVKVSIDKTNPRVDIRFDQENGDSLNEEFYRNDRTATITINERNFDPAGVLLSVENTDGTIPALSDWSTVANGGDPDANSHTATLLFHEDGDYTVSMQYTDIAGNKAVTFEPQSFTIDQTIPEIEVSFDNERAVNGNYYAEARTATVKIMEHNFEEDRIELTGTASDNGSSISFPQAGGWRTNGDEHTATISFDRDGVYEFQVSVMDMAGNEAEMERIEEYCIDLTEPQIEIEGIENLSANNGTVAPIIRFIDTNYDRENVSIELSGANRGRVEAEGNFTVSDRGQTFRFNDFKREQAIDDIYTLKVAEEDMAGNRVTEEIIFSVNRFGSVYVLDETLKNIQGSYIQKPMDIVLRETNVDDLDEDSIRVMLTTNGIPRDLTKNMEYTLSKVGGGTWSQYEYKIDKSVFAGDGKYVITVYSEDHAGNINENIEESKKAEIKFGVDGTAPVILPINLESETDYNAEEFFASVSVKDNLVLQSVQISLNGEQIEYQKQEDTYDFVIPEDTRKQSVVILAQDAAGNAVTYEAKDILVSTNSFVRWYNNKPIFIGSIAGAGGVVGGASALVGLRRRKMIRVKRK